MIRAAICALLLLAAVATTAAAGAAPASGKLSFDDLKPGELPEGWKVEATNPEGALARWEVVAGQRAGAATNFLAVTAIPDESKGHFNLCWTDRITIGDGSLSVWLRGDSGKVDQGGGPIWRVRDARNYYLARYNPLEKNLRLYRVQDGQRSQLGESVTVAMGAGQWMVLKVAFSGERMEVWLDYRKILEAKDAALAEAGGVGLWTKADAATSFDDFEYQSGGAGDDAYRSEDARFAEADAALNEARLATSNAAAAAARIGRLQDVVARFPDYPHRAMAEYYLGLNCQLLERYDEAAKAFAAALRDQPELQFKTSILSYLETARKRRFASRASTGLIVLLVAVLIVAFWRLARADAADVPWRRLVPAFGLALVVWAVLVVLLPIVLGPPSKGLEGFSKPTLADFRLGQLGDYPLRALLRYGTFAILAVLPVVGAVSLLKRPASRAILGTLGVLLVTGSLMGLFTLRHCWGQSRYAGGRVIFLVKDIATMGEVPDQMLPLYDPEFRERILESRKKKSD